jgi:plasmid stability protein
MAGLTIRSVPEEARALLRLSAAKAGRNLEAESITILGADCLSDEKARSRVELQVWVDLLHRGKKPGGGAEALIAERRRKAKRG